MATKATSSQKYLQLLLLQVTLLGPVSCGKVLVWPTEGSHWLNVKIIIQELIHRGHNVTILVSNASLFIKPAEATEKFEVYNVPFETDTVENLIRHTVALWLDNRPTTLTFWQFYKELGKLSKNWNQMNRLMCDAVVTNQELMAHLQESGYDLVLSDPVTPCGELVALKLAIPFIYSLRFSPAFTLERHCGKIPTPPSYTPAALSELTDSMSFSQRIKNILSYHLQDYGKTPFSRTGFHTSYLGCLPSRRRQHHTGPAQCEVSPQGHFHTGLAMAGKEVTVLWLLAVLGWGSGGKVLVWPADNSHWLNMDCILQELVVRGHQVTVLLPSCFLILDPAQPSPFQFEVVKVPITKEEMAASLEETFYFFFYKERTLPAWKSIYEAIQIMYKLENLTKIICDEVLKNKALLERLRTFGFDVFLIDPLVPSGELVAEKLGIPFVYTIRFSIGNTVERHCGALPAPPSYIPATLSHLTDRMSFLERLKNTFTYTILDMMLTWLLWTCMCCWSTGFCGKVVVWPTDASHWINMKVLLEELVHRGHEVTVLVASSNLLINYQDTSSPFTFEVLQVPFSQQSLEALMEDFLNLWLNEASNLYFWEKMQRLKKDLEIFSYISKQTCDTLVMNPQLIAKLRQAKFDIVIADPLALGGELVAEILAIPFVYSFRFSDGNVAERLCGGLPSPPSYVPASTNGLTDQMSFEERLQNFLFYLYTDLFFLKFWQDEWDGYYSNVLGRTTTLCETMGKAEIWLIRTYWDFEFPRPFLPNFEFVGGLHCQPAKPLPKEMEEFVQSSGEHGIVVFSLGSMVNNLTDEKSNIIARALSQLPQKVLWRYKGKKPEALGSNTRIYDWIPQNDLLGHPLAKAFLTHGGTNGIYEAIYHGIPMVGIPMFADQHDNIAHMRAKGAAVELDFNRLTTQDLVNALNTVINNSTYKENALRLSKIHHDQPIKPLDRAVFWVEFVMRHKGAKHLRPAAHHLTWYQYHCLDVLAFLLACAAIAVFILVKCCLFCCRRCGRIAKRKKD
ncbi:Ugt2a1 [Columba guinea]|nr:Ugt2a1 [Columba guinea]